MCVELAPFLRAGRQLSDPNSWLSRAEIGGDLHGGFRRRSCSRDSDLSIRLSRRISG
jgi:hypothetical protein